MSNKCKNIINPLRVEREGNDQKGRIKPDLLPESCPVDARTEIDDLVFVKEFARKISYYDIYNQKNGNWGQFFDTDLTITLANIALQNESNFRGWIQSEIEKIKDNTVSLAEKKKSLTNLFKYVVNLAWQLDMIYRRMPEGLPFRVFLENQIFRLAPFFNKMVSYYKGAVAVGIIDETGSISQKVFGEKIETASEIIFNKSFSLRWNYAGGVATPQDNSIYGTGTDDHQLYLGATHNFFTDILYRFLQTYTRTIQEAKLQFEKLLTKSDHEPHITLLLSFIKLFQYSRQHLNGLSARHLDLYYRDILKLSEKAPQPNQVHINFELAKRFEQFLLEKGAFLKAGKDAAGKDVFYKTESDLTISQAKINSLRSFYRGTQADDDNKSGLMVYKNRLFASENLIEKEGINWQPFVQKNYEDGKLTGISTPKALIGFAVASNHLFLREGNRTITLTLTLTNLPATLPVNLKDHFGIELTGEKGWIQPATLTSVNGSGNQLIFIFNLDEKVPSILPYAGKVHGGQFGTALPVMKVVLLHIDNEPFIYQYLENVFVNNVNVTVNVSGVKNLHLQNDFGILDASKAFLPFGAIPLKDKSSFIMGSNELFQKKLTSLSLTWDWKDGTYAGDVNPDYILRKGAWAAYAQPVQADDISVPTYGDNPLLSTGNTEGFIKTVFSGDFQTAYNTYLKNVTDALKPATTSAPPSAPNPPIANALQVSYTAEINYNIDSDSDFPNRNISFFHMTPFGCEEKHHKITSGTSPLLPQFQHKNANDPFFVLKDISGNVIAGDIEHEGEFYLGLQELKLPGMISILFQVEDGSANPLIDKPEFHIHWSFLTGNGWKSFLKSEVFDNTLQLTKSGVISFNIPVEASSENTSMPLGNLWIKAAVNDADEAVCRIAGVHPHAVLCTLQEAVSHPDLLEKPLPEETISKLAVPEAAIKKVTQNYDSFGGRPSEQSDQFYKRISERLRHKDRAVTVWDYENLILEAFPAIYKVKCLNHTRYETSGSGDIYNELSPRHVTIVTLPNLRNQRQIDPLKPYTSVDVLSEIDKFLTKRTSAFVKLHVKNPIFEEVKVSCKVKFFPQYDASLQVITLQKEITQFLSPWAFDAGSEIVFGGKTEKSVLINFIEEREYVDYLTDMKLYHKHDGIEEETETAKAAKGISVLVSVSSKNHIIDIIPPSADILNLETCRC
ncbi:Baseplate J-like protein [Pseudarcicella hirudinis]|uniref:Baseplate J-like protein n=1 Tax=Pseudarcicella hirudinis TaxID=1079859 RepID=A0A1I5N510_9BACT|nr:baseplate J/gp47 family protein [Pseudarcicella hirudinis]SFP16898.1 Baseplate J-like protein [Pseudarcicella hirudinis]